MRSLKFTTKSGPTKIQGKFIQFKKGPLQIQNYFQGNEDQENNSRGKRKKIENSFQFFQLVRVIWGKIFGFLISWGGPRLIRGILISRNFFITHPKILSIFGGGPRLIYFSFFALDHALYTFFFLLKHYNIFTLHFYTLFFP